MRHRIAGNRMSMPEPRRRSARRNLMAGLIRYDRIETTETRARASRGEVEKLIDTAVKGRQEARALPILVNSVQQALVLVRDREPEASGLSAAPDSFARLTAAFWPGALTLVMDASHRVPLKVTANTGKVALRWPKSPLVDQLINEFEGPITGTSANVSGFPSCSSADQVMKQLGGRLPLVLDAGDTGAALASTIIELHGEEEWRVLREGAIPVAEIERTLQ